MACTYHTLLRQIALRTNSLVGATPTPLETSYITTPLTTAQFNGGDFSFTSHKDAIINAEEKFAQAIASVMDENGQGIHPYRSYLTDVTAALANEAAIPPTSTLSQPIIGTYGSVFDASDGSSLTMKPVAIIRRYNAESWRTYPNYHFRIVGTRIYHTRTAVQIEVCVYNRATQAALVTSNGNMLLPDVLEPALVDEALRQMVRDDAFMGQSALFGGYADQWLQAIQRGTVLSQAA